MNKVIDYVFLTFIFSLIFITTCNAECSYQERKDLLNEAKNVTVDMEINHEKITTEGSSVLDENTTFTYDEYTINFSVYNITENLFIKYYNNFDYEERYISSGDLVNGVYTFSTKNLENIMKYKFEIYSTHKNCSGEEITSKTVIKPKLNNFYVYGICSEEMFKEHKYCKQFITEELNLSESEFFNWAEEMRKSFETEENDTNIMNDIFNLLKKYWYLATALLLIIFLILGVLLWNKKRSELK